MCIVDDTVDFLNTRLIPLGKSGLESSGCMGSCADVLYFFEAKGYGECWGSCDILCWYFCNLFVMYPVTEISKYLFLGYPMYVDLIVIPEYKPPVQFLDIS